jgi:hypothetical protein
MEVARATDDDAPMQTITPPRPVARRPLGPVVAGTAIGTVLIVVGVVLGVLAFATPLLSMVLPSGRVSADRTLIAIVVWAAALVAPAALVLFGASRLARILGGVQHKPRRSALVQSIGTLPENVVVASGLTMPDGRTVSDLALGPFGAAVIRELPPAAITRIRNGHWEVRMRKGWVPLEHPLERASRDAERVRRWLCDDDVDFVVKTYAAVVGPDPTVERTAACAVLTPDQLGSWIAGLPPQRSLTPGRLEQMFELAREAAV